MTEFHFRDDLAAAINRHSRENPSNTPDFIMAEFLLAVTDAWDRAVQQRETWYGRDARPATPTTKPADGMLIHCQKCGHEYSATCEACPFCLSAWKSARTQIQYVPQKQEPGQTGLYPPCIDCGHSRTSHQAGQCSGRYSCGVPCICREYITQ